MALAVLRLYFLLAYDNGPWDVIARMRMRVGVLPYENAPGYLTTNSLAYALMCPSCSTIWYAILMMVGYSFYPAATIYAATILALSMLAVMLRKLV